MRRTPISSWPSACTLFGLVMALGCSGPTARTSPGTSTGGTGGSGPAGPGGQSGMAGGPDGTGGGGALDGSASPTGSAGLPLVVTNAFNNQGWFADPTVSASFAPGSMVIKQGDSLAGPCAARDPKARGKCLAITYTPPAGLTPPSAGGYVGVFFLSTLLHDHPEATPPAQVGDANWGVEPGVPVPAGATRISFKAASATDQLHVTFKAGTDRDSFLVPPSAVSLGTAWAPQSLSLAGMSYGATVIGGFAWVLLDTTKPATFYLDDIVWE
jgi:hypothetical protein